jgi:DNA-binding response OmpR family regulator
MKRILVVDDNKDILQVVQIILQIRGFEVKAIWRGEETVQAVHDFSPHIILLDIMLGNVNGIDICNQIKSNPATKDICVIMFSAHGKREEILQQCPGNNFIAKPFDVHSLANTIEEELSKCN